MAEDGTVLLPPNLSLTIESLTRAGVFLLENTLEIVIWIGMVVMVVIIIMNRISRAAGCHACDVWCIIMQGIGIIAYYCMCSRMFHDVLELYRPPQV